MKVDRKWLSGGMGLGLIAVCMLTIAAVPGIFSSVNSVNGYQLNGAAVSGEALCGSGSGFYDTPCSVASGGVTSAIGGTGIHVSSATGAVTFSYTGPANFFYQTVTGFTQEPALTFSGNFAPSDNPGVATNIELHTAGAGSATYTCPASVTVDGFARVTAVSNGTCPSSPGTGLTVGTNGYYEIQSNGTIVDHVNLTALPNDNAYHAYGLPHAFASFVASFVCSVDRPGGNPGPVGVQSGGLSSINILSNTGGSGTLMNVSCVVTGQ